MSLIPNDEDRARQAGFTQGAAMAEAENARLRAEIERLTRRLEGATRLLNAWHFEYHYGRRLEGIDDDTTTWLGGIDVPDRAADQPDERPGPPWLCRCGMHNAWMRDKCGGCGGLRTWTGAADNSPPLQVTCARCGLAGTSDTFYIEEGDEWECPACWERCEAAERAAAEELLMNGGKKK